MNHIKRLVDNFRAFISNTKREQYIDTLIKGVDEHRQPLYKTLLNNELNYLANESQSNRTPKAQKAHVDFMMAVTKQVIDKIYILSEIVGIQPMNGPVGLVFRLKFEQNDDNQMTLSVVKDPIVAVTRPLLAVFTNEAVQNLNTLHSIDVAKELQNMLSREIADEIIAEVVSDLYRFGQTNKQTVPLTKETSVYDSALKLMVAINMAASEIARNTRRAAGNFIITSPIGVATLQGMKLQGLKYQPVEQQPGKLFTFGHVGNLTTMEDKVLYRVYTTLHLPLEASDTYIVGFKGGTGEIDTGYIYAPYVVIMQSGIIVDEETFAPRQQLLTRYGKFTTTKTTGEVGSSAYYRNVEHSLFFQPPVDQQTEEV